MPELPEVETTRRHLEPAMVGRRIVAVEVRRDRMVRYQEQPSDFSRRVTGRMVERLRRHGKFLVGDLDGGVTLVAHLGMSGRFGLSRVGDEESPHTNVVFRLDDGTEVRFVDPRTFGFVLALVDDELAASALGRLGRDALEDLPPSRALAAALEGRTAPLKALLLDQGIVAGLGNIYADEALYRARIAPQRPGGSLGGDEVKALRAAIKTTMAAGLARGGTTLDDLAYLLPDGRAGEFTSRLLVYGREDLPCRRCGTPIRRTVIRQRSSHWCPVCQT